MDSTPLPEVLSWFANSLAVIAVFGALIAVILESREADAPTIAPILAAVGVIVFLVGNVLRYVMAAYQ